ncbi:hypothetical protein PRIPAC_70930, partial [Pristionchus pacificus]
NGSAGSSIASAEETGRLLGVNQEEEEEEEEDEMRIEDDMADTDRECPLCFNRVSKWAFPQMLGCPDHASCIHCLIRYVELEVMENRVEVSCPECPAKLHPTDVRAVLRSSAGGEAALAKYEEFSVRKCLLTEPDTRWCPAPDCGYAVIAAGCAACPQLRCSRPACGTLFCYHCKDIWHDSMTCEEARRTRGIFAVSAATSGESRRGILRGYGRRSSIALRRGSSRMSSEAMVLKPGDVKSCPRCRALIVKMDDGSCNHMVCAMCSTEFCWLCLKEISDLHYLSPTGCTFWGKKPWTRKKKLAWQLGTLIGAPLGIALIAGLSVPGIIFGVPVLVGRKVHTRFMHHTKVRRRLITAACVAGSLVVSPVLAVMAVGVGVPIMLAYVYGVVPLSLCRNGGCGWSSQLIGDEPSEDELWTAAGSEAEVVGGPEGAGPSGLTGLAASSSGDVASAISLAMGGGGGGGCGGSASLASAGGAYATERRAASAADAASLAPATSLHSGFSVWTARGKSCGDSETCSTGAAKRVRRPSSESGGVTSLNYEEASTKGLAGSQYHYDDKSVHTLGSQAPELLSCCDDVASTKALAGSVHDTKSLSGSAVVHDVCDEPSTSGGGACYGSHHHHHHAHHNPHRRSVSSTRQCKSHSLSGCGSRASGAAGDHRDGGREGSTLSEDDDEIVHDCTGATPTGLSHSSSSPFTLVTPAMTPHLSVFAMHAAVAAAAATGSSSSSAAAGPSISHAAAAAAASSSTSSSNPDPFGIRTLLDNMKQMVAADEADCEPDDVYRPEPLARSRDSGASSMSPAGRDLESGVRPPPPARQVSASSTRGSGSGGADADTPTPARRTVRWLPSFLTKKSKQ